MAKSKFNYKTVVSIFLAVTMLLCLTITSSAVEPRYSDTDTVNLTIQFSGTTAYCTVSVSGAYGTKSISEGKLVLKDSVGGVVKSWDNISSSSDSLFVSKTVTDLTSGEKYTLSFSAKANRNGKLEPISSFISQYC